MSSMITRMPTAPRRRRRTLAAALLVAISALSVSLAVALPAAAEGADPGPKAKSPQTDLTAFPKLTTEQLATKAGQERAERAKNPAGATGGSDVISTESLPDGSVRVDTYTPVPGVSPEQLVESLRKQGVKDVRVDRHDDVTAQAPSDCAWGQARSVTCPVSYWTNSGHHNPVVLFNDLSDYRWPTNNAVYKWNQTPNIDSWYKYNATWDECNPHSSIHCVEVKSGNYGATGWLGHTTRYYIPPNHGRLIGAKVELNNSYGVPGTTYDHVVTHELGHALGLGHNMWSGDVMYTSANMREDIGGENPMMLASIYSIDR